MIFGNNGAKISQSGENQSLSPMVRGFLAEDLPRAEPSGTLLQLCPLRGCEDGIVSIEGTGDFLNTGIHFLV